MKQDLIFVLAQMYLLKYLLDALRYIISLLVTKVTATCICGLRNHAYRSEIIIL